MKSRCPASQGSAAVRSVVVGRICSMRRRARNRIEQGKQQQTSKKPADMRLPGDAGAVRADGDRSDAEDDVDAEPDAEKPKHAPVAQRTHQRQRRYLCGGIRIAATERQEAASHEGKADRR